MTLEPTKNTPAKAKKSRAGRNLPASIAVGVGLGALVLALLLAPPVCFLVFIMVVAVMAEVEMAFATPGGGQHRDAGLRLSVRSGGGMGGATGYFDSLCYLAVE